MEQGICPDTLRSVLYVVCLLFSYWVEYPPVFPFLLNTLVFHLASGSQFLYDFILYFLLALFGAACIYIFSRIADVLWGEEIGGVRSNPLFRPLNPFTLYLVVF